MGQDRQAADDPDLIRRRRIPRVLLPSRRPRQVAPEATTVAGPRALSIRLASACSRPNPAVAAVSAHRQFWARTVTLCVVVSRGSARSGSMR